MAFHLIYPPLLVLLSLEKSDTFGYMVVASFSGAQGGSKICQTLQVWHIDRSVGDDSGVVVTDMPVSWECLGIYQDLPRGVYK